MGELVVKAVNEAGGYGMLVGPQATRRQKADFRERIRRDPRNYIAQPRVELSTCPAWTPRGVAPRRVDLRPYIYTGGGYENRVQSEASHAWAELYLPRIGWRGFDPTNGCLTQADHVRMGCGRSYSDATPTSGTIYEGGGEETLTVDVRVTEIAEEHDTEL